MGMKVLILALLLVTLIVCDGAVHGGQDKLKFCIVTCKQLGFRSDKKFDVPLSETLKNKLCSRTGETGAHPLTADYCYCNVKDTKWWYEQVTQASYDAQIAK